MDTPQTNLHPRLDELSLKDIIQSIFKKKWVALLCLILMVLVAVVHGLMVKPVYEGSVLIQIGEIPILPGFTLNSGANLSVPLEDPVKLAQRLKITKKPYSVTVDKVDKISTNIITITYRAHNPITAKSYLKKITAELVKQHDALLYQALKLRKDQINSLQNQINSVQIQLDFCEKQIGRVISNDSLKMWMTMEKMRLLQSRFDLEERMRDQELLISDIYVKPTRILEEPTLAQRPIKPNWREYIGWAVIFGSITGVIAAVFLDRVYTKKKPRTN